MDDLDGPQASSNVTADDVAARAGVSRWTVARAFKKDAPISERSRRSVLAAAEALGYVPDLLAASLASDRSGLVALLVDDFDNPHKLVMLEGLTRVLQREGWGTLLINIGHESEIPQALLTASQRRVDAAVLIGTEFDDAIIGTALGARRVKKLIVFARVSQDPQTLSICCDDAAAMREIADHLLAGSFRRPLFVGGPDGFSATLTRKATFLEAWREHRGITPEVVHVPRYDARLAFDLLLARLRDKPEAEHPDLIVCENDVLAIGVMDAIRHGLGRSVPDDIAVVGFDDIPLAASPAYELTTYRQPLAAMGDALVAVLKSSAEPVGSQFLRGEFVVRRTA